MAQFLDNQYAIWSLIALMNKDPKLKSFLHCALLPCLNSLFIREHTSLIALSVLKCSKAHTQREILTAVFIDGTLKTKHGSLAIFGKKRGFILHCSSNMLVWLNKKVLLHLDQLLPFEHGAKSVCNWFYKRIV